MPTTTTAGRNWAVGFAKQTALVTGSSTSTGALTATTGNSPAIDAGGTGNQYSWPRWLQGSFHYPEGQYNHEWEGDGSRGESLSYKRFQVGRANITCYPRPNILLGLLSAFTGKNSAYTATSLSTSSDTPAPASTSIVTLPGNDVGNDIYSVASLLRGTTYTLKTADALCHNMVLSAGVGQPFKLATQWAGGANIVGDAIPGTALHIDPNGPYFFFDGIWTVKDSAATPNLLDFGAAVKDFTLTFETTLNPEDYQAENIMPLPLAAGNMTVSGEITVLWQSAEAMNLAYFGSATAPSTVDVGSAIASRSGFGNLQVRMQSGSIWNAAASPPALTPDHSCWATFEFPAANYEGVTFEPDLSGKPIEQRIMLHMTKGQCGTVVTTSLSNGGGPAATQVPYAVNIDIPPTN